MRRWCNGSHAGFRSLSSQGGEGSSPSRRTFSLNPKGKKSCADHLNEARASMDKTVQMFSNQLFGIRVGIISPQVIDTVKVEYHGQKVPIGHVAGFKCDKQRICIEPYDTQLLGPIVSACKASGFNAYIFSKTQAVVSYNALSGKEREKVINQVRHLAEEARVAVRNIRKKARQAQEKDHKHLKISKDEITSIDKPLQKLTDDSIGRINSILEDKLASL